MKIENDGTLKTLTSDADPEYDQTSAIGRVDTNVGRLLRRFGGLRGLYTHTQRHGCENIKSILTPEKGRPFPLTCSHQGEVLTTGQL